MPRRQMVSDRLARSNLIRGMESTASPREIAIVVGFINHPVLLREAFDYFAGLELPAGDLARLHSAVLNVCSVREPGSRDELVAEIEAAGLEGAFADACRALRHLRLWPFLADAAPEDAREAVRQALHLHHRARFLSKELRSAELMLGSDPSESSYLQIVEIKQEIETLHGVEALIDGFGVLSGRAAKTF